MNLKKLVISLFEIVLILSVLSGTQPALLSQDLDVLQSWLQFSDSSNSLYNYLLTEASEILEKNTSDVDQLKTRQDWLEQQEKSRVALRRVIGPFPEKTPLNAEITGVYEGDGYRMEKVVYESMPGYHVTAGLFIPDEAKNAPAVIYCSGHTENGFRSDVYQWVILNLVKKGFVVLAFDPVGQGERWQYFDPDTGESAIGGPTSEHSYPGTQAFLTGLSMARYMIWDGIRTVDFLETRPEVDSSRIGITGRSGGGTQSAQIAAMDDRILAAAPECYITSYRRLLESIGPQDAEQNLYRGIIEGTDHLDLLLARAPKPTMMITTTGDFFSIQGARETYARAGKAWKALGAPEAIDMAEDDGPHASTLKNREAMYAFFQKYLDLPGSSQDEQVEVLAPADIRVTKTGQVVTSYDGKTIFEIIREEGLKRITSAAPGNLAAEVKQISGYRKPVKKASPVFTGRLVRDGYVIEKYFAEGEGGYPVPFLLFVPDGKDSCPAVLYLHPEGKSAAAGRGQEIESIVKSGYAVLTPDLVGLGETGPGSFTGDAWNFKVGRGDYNIWYLALHLGRSLVAPRAADLNMLADFLGSKFSAQDQGITAIARGNLGPVLQHAALMNEKITRIALLDSPASYRMLIENEFYKPEMIHSTVAGALLKYDLPDLAESLASRDLLLINPVDQRAVAMRKEEAGRVFNKKVKTECELTPAKAGEALLDWLK
jgi:pimeloyl-ACP methyl ester carboxylesterase